MAKKVKTSSFRGKTNQDAKKQKSSEKSYGYLKLPNNIHVFSPEPGSKNVRMDILPYVVSDTKHPDRDNDLEIARPGDLWYKRPFKVHRNVGPSNETLVCPTSFGKRCPICEYRAKRLKEGADKTETDELRPSMRNLYIVVPKGVKKYEEIPHILDISHYLFQNLLNDELEENEDYSVFPDLEEGLTLKVRWDSKQFGKSNPYAEASRIDFEERDEPYDDSILEEIPNLDTILKETSYEDLEAKFFDVEPEEQEEEQEEEEEEEASAKPAKKFGRKNTSEEEEEDQPKRKKKPEPEPEEEDEEEEEEDSLPDQIAAAKTVGQLLSIATNNKEFKKHLKILNTITKSALLKNEMLAILNPEPEEEDEEEAPAPQRRSKPTPKKEEEEDEEEEEEDTKPVKKPAKPSNTSYKFGDDCPEGHVFGKDCDKFEDDCDSCKLWEKCIEARDKNKNKK